jgi:F-type H+-transporting ATPase subunit alpha
MTLEQEVTILYAAINGYLDDVPLAKIAALETAFHKFMASNHPEIGKDIASTKDLTAETEEALKKGIVEFKQSGAY